MRTAARLLLVVLGTAAPALAQPGPACDVVIVRAPAAVRAEIERWVASEPRCQRGLELRVLETPDGLYLFARDDRGFTRERTVPDAASAGALVASWIADDSVDGVWVMPPQAPALASLPASDRGHTLRLVGVSVALAGVAMLGGGIYEWHEAARISAEIGNHPPQTPWPDDIGATEARGKRAERLEYTLLASGGALVVGGTVAYLVGHARAKPEQMVVVPTASAQDVSVGLAGRF